MHLMTFTVRKTHFFMASVRTTKTLISDFTNDKNCSLNLVAIKKLKLWMQRAGKG